MPLYRQTPTVKVADLQELRVRRTDGGKLIGEVAHQTVLGSMTSVWELTTGQRGLIVGNFLPDAKAAIAVRVGELGLRGSVANRNILKLVFRRAGGGNLLGRVQFRYALGTGGEAYIRTAWGDWLLSNAQKQEIVAEFLSSAVAAAQQHLDRLAA